MKENKLLLYKLTLSSYIYTLSGFTVLVNLITAFQPNN